MYDPPPPSAREVLIGLGIWIALLAVAVILLAGVAQVVVHTAGWPAS
jgi:hypothetical protein